MIQNRFLRNISANTLQLLINQSFGLLIFYALSRGLDKSAFGGLNWVLAVLLTVFSVLTFGIDQLMVKKIAAGHDRISVFSAYLFHVIITGAVFYLLIFIQYLLFPNFIPRQDLMLLIGIGKLMLFLSTPFKQVTIAVEKFSSLLYMSVVSNVFRGIGLLICLLMNNLSLDTVIIIFISGDIAELVICILIARPVLQTGEKIKWNRKEQLRLFMEALPQAGVTAFNAIMSRFDWILIGLLVSSVKLAEYSFAWKLYEVSTLPLFILAPIILPLFSRIYRNANQPPDLSFFLEWQIMFASFVALFLNVIWGPVVDVLTEGKYGAVNTNTIFILSLGMPLLYLNNYLWTINFAKGKLKLVFSIIGISLAANIISCIILVKLYQNEGAAVANFIAMLVQAVLYIKVTGLGMSTKQKLRLLAWPALAIACGFLGRKYIHSDMYGIILPLLVYFLVLIFSRQVRSRDWKALQGFYQ